MYVLMAEEAGGRRALEEGLRAWADAIAEEEYAFSDDRFDPEVPVPETVANEMLDLMDMGGMARPREK